MRFLRLWSILDAVSYLILLCIAMPMKYMLDIPEGVRLVGSAHGFFFIMLIYSIITRFFMKVIDFKWAVIVAVASVIPVLPFFLDAKLKKLDQTK